MIMYSLWPKGTLKEGIIVKYQLAYKYIVQVYLSYEYQPRVTVLGWSSMQGFKSVKAQVRATFI